MDVPRRVRGENRTKTTLFVLFTGGVAGSPTAVSNWFSIALRTTSKHEPLLSSAAPGTWMYPAAYAARTEQKPRFLFCSRAAWQGARSPFQTGFPSRCARPRSMNPSSRVPPRVHGCTPPRTRRQQNKNHAFCSVHGRRGREPDRRFKLVFHRAAHDLEA